MSQKQGKEKKAKVRAHIYEFVRVYECNKIVLCLVYGRMCDSFSYTFYANFIQFITNLSGITSVCRTPCELD